MTISTPIYLFFHIHNIPTQTFKHVPFQYHGDFICFVLDIPLNTATTAHICMSVGPSECKHRKPSVVGTTI